LFREFGSELMEVLVSTEGEKEKTFLRGSNT
jgi:hypothetical protein